jgi:hypothetical protein
LVSDQYFQFIEGILYNKPATQIIWVPTGLTGDIHIPEGVTSISNSAFKGCTGLTSVTIPDSVTSINGGAFSGCSNLANIVLSGTAKFCFVDGILYDNPVTKIIWVSDHLPSELTILAGVTTIDNDVFTGKRKLTSVIIPSGVTSIGHYAFRACGNLTSVTIPDSVTTIEDRAFDGCIALATLVLGKGVTSIGSGAFPAKIKEVYISDMAAWLRIPFKGGPGTWANSFTSNNPLSGGAKLYLNGVLVENLVIPDGVTQIGAYAFHGCSSLTSITIPNIITTIGEGAFCGCYFLTSVTIPDSVTTIGGQVFCYCGSLTSVTIGDSVTTIG